MAYEHLSFEEPAPRYNKYGGMEIPEIAEKLHCSQDHVKMILKKAIKNLQRKMLTDLHRQLYQDSIEKEFNTPQPAFPNGKHATEVETLRHPWINGEQP